MEYQYKYKGNTSSNVAVGGRPRRRPEKVPAPVAPGESTRSGDRSLAQVLAAVFGLVFLLVGVAGFIPGVTSNYDDLRLLGTDSGAELLGLFRVSIVHNLVHALFGVGLIAAGRAAWARAYLLGGGVAYALVAVLGSVVESDSDANFLPVNGADNLLHVALSGALLAAGLVAVAADRRARR